MLGYEFHEKDDTDEVHIFEGTITGVTTSTLTGTTNKTSICKGATKPAGKPKFGRIATTYEARKFAAGLGKSVCGICVSHFYKTHP